MVHKKLTYQNALIMLFLVSVLILSIIKIEDTDTWMHLSLGRLIWEYKGFPSTEQYVYPNFGQPFSYSSWLFGLLYYLIYRLLDIPGVIILKAITITTAFYILIRDSLRPYRNAVVATAVMIAVVVFIRCRFAERPETFMMVFLSFSIFSLNAYLYEKKKYIYFLPVVHMLWANCHSSINLMVIPFTAFIAGGLLQRYFSKKDMMVDTAPTLSQIKTVGLIFAGSFAASLISPYFISQYFFGAQFLSTPWFKQEILELQKPEWRIAKWLYLGSACVALSFVLNRKRISLIHIFTLLPFLILPFTAKRFIILFAIVSGPILARNISSVLDSKSWNRFSNRGFIISVASICIIIITALAITKGTLFDGGRKKFGLGIESSFVPEYALQYLDGNKIEGRVFNVFEWGGYIVWRDFPRRTVFVDPRGYLSVDLLEKMVLAINHPSVLDALEKKYAFDSVLMKYTKIDTEIQGMDWGLVHPLWALVYWDDTALVYLKKGGKYNDLIERDEYRFVKPANGLLNLKNALQNEAMRENIIKELKRNIKDTNSSKARMLLGYVYNETGLYKEALEIFSKLEDTALHEYLSQSYSGMAYAYEHLGNTEKAIEYYKKTLSETNEAGSFFEIGRLYFGKGDRDNALKYFAKTLEKDRSFAPVYPFIISVYRDLGKTGKVRDLEKAYAEVSAKKATTELFNKGLDAYFAGRFDEALIEFGKSIEINPLDAESYSNMGYIYYDMGDMSNAFVYQQKAIQINPNLANAHFGIAMIYKRQRDFQSTKRHLEEYLRIEPEGYYSRRAQEEIKALNKVMVGR